MMNYSLKVRPIISTDLLAFLLKKIPISDILQHYKFVARHSFSNYY